MPGASNNLIVRPKTRSCNMPSMNKKLFLSAVSSEFESYRKLLTSDLKRPTLDVAVQEDFIVNGGSTLDKLDEYMRACDGVVHLIGKATGAIPETIAVQRLLARHADLPGKLPALADRLALPDPGFSYTQWEAYLAIYYDLPVFVYWPEDLMRTTTECPRDARFVCDADQERAQREHYERIAALGRDRGTFKNAERLSSAVLRDLVQILPALHQRLVVPPSRLRHTAEVLVGREKELTMLDTAWNEDSHTNIVVVRGKGGEGKTSLVASWMAELAMKDWRGAERVFDWSFYSQGTKDQTSATSEYFMQAALEFFGDKNPITGGAYERGARLAELVGMQRCLLVLDGLEPLQYPPGPMHGQLKDPGMAALLRGLVAQNAGLCVITTREKIDEVKQHYGMSAVDHSLEFLSPLAGAELLYRAGAQRAGAARISAGDSELQQASSEVRGHALTLSLIGQFLKLTEEGDIRRRDRMKLHEADAEFINDPTRSYGHAFKAIEAYQVWFETGGTRAQQLLAVLRLLGFFDRPASKDCLTALRGELIPGLNDSLVGASQQDWRLTLGRLKEINLIDVTDDETIDCHPLIREYFAANLQRQRSAVFQAGHSRLFDHLVSSSTHRPDSLIGLQPLYQAVTHGCLAQRHKEALFDVYIDRILRGTGHGGGYSTAQLGAVGSNLGAVAAFFDVPWTTVTQGLDSSAASWILGECGRSLEALGRLQEAGGLLELSAQHRIDNRDWKNAAVSTGNLCQLNVMLGLLEIATINGRDAIDYADRSGDFFQRMSKRCRAAVAYHRAGKRGEALKLFQDAESMLAESDSSRDHLYSLMNFTYCEVLLDDAEKVIWRESLAANAGTRLGNSTSFDSSNAQMVHKSTSSEKTITTERKWAIDSCKDVFRRATVSLQVSKTNSWLLDVGLDLLMLAQSSVYQRLLTDSDLEDLASHTLAVTESLSAVRKATSIDYLPLPLLFAAFHAGTLGNDPAAAHRYLDEAQQIAERGPMPLYLADVHLHRARLFRDKSELMKAAMLIHTHKYGRRYDELADAEAAATNW